MAEAFGLDMGFGCKTERHDDGRTLSKSKEDSWLENKRKKEENRAYFLTTMCLNAVLTANYRAPHEMVLWQATKSLGTSRSVNDFCALFGLCITERGRYGRKEIMVCNRQNNELIPKDVSMAAMAWDNNDMKLTTNLVGQDYVSFWAAWSVGTRNETLRLRPESE